MHSSAPARRRPPPTRRLRVAGWRALAPLLLLAGLIARPAPARADECDDCPPPTKAQITALIPGGLGVREGIGGKATDEIHMDRGSCISTMTSAPTVTPINQWLVLRAMGEVWNCPHSKSTDTIVARSGSEDSSEWSTSVTGGLKLKGLVAEVKGEIQKGNVQGTKIVEVTEVSKQVLAAWCRRIPWQGYFLVGRYRAEATFSIKQEWAWWTKNVATGSTVHASGTIQVSCGTALIQLERRAPTAGFFLLSQAGCQDPACASVPEKSLGWFPPLPPEVDPAGGGDESDEPAEPEVAETPAEDEGPVEEDPSVPESSGDLDDPPGGPVPDPIGE